MFIFIFENTAGNIKKQSVFFQIFNRISSNYFLRDLLLSGDVLVNDPLGNYVNRVADELLKNDPELRKQIHIYVIKSPHVNAHAFDKGFIFINVGLLLAEAKLVNFFVCPETISTQKRSPSDS